MNKALPFLLLTATPWTVAAQTLYASAAQPNDVSAATPQPAHGQVVGRVVLPDGQPAEHASVVVKATSYGTNTEADGSFRLRLPAGSQTLAVVYLGYVTQEFTVEVPTKNTLSLAAVTLAKSDTHLAEVQVTEVRKPYTRPLTAGKSTIRPLDLPQSVGVVSSAVIEDQQVQRLGDALRNVSGVSLTQQRQGVAETFSSRGFSIGIAGSGGSIFKNGVISNTQGFPDASTLESVEVLKGSSALLYGNVSGGLVINMVTKKPKFDWGGEASLRVGSYSLYKPIVDVYGPISKNLAFRVVGTYENAKSFRDVVHSERVYVNPSLLYKIGERTDILVQADYLKSDLVPDNGVGVPNANIDVQIPDNTPRSRFINAVWANNQTDQLSGSVVVNHSLNERWKLTLIGSAQTTQVDGYGLSVPSTVQANGDWSRTLNAAKTAEKNFTGQLNANGKFNTGFLAHQVLVGADALRIESESNTFRFTGATGVVGTAYDKINIYDPGKFEARTDIPDRADTARTISPSDRFGAYVQDLITLSPKFKVLGGVRWSYQKVYRTSIFNQNAQQERPGTAASKADRVFSPKAALIYQPLPTLSVYGSYANFFTINTGTNLQGQQLDPSIVDQFEVGAKNELLGGKLFTSVSAYHYVNSNLAQTSLVDPTRRELTGETTSDGVDADVNGTFSRNFYFNIGYGYNFHRYTNTSGRPGAQVEGERLINNPAHTANASIFYTFDRPVLRGLKLGASAFYTGQRFGGVNNTVDQTPVYNRLVSLTGFTTVDLSAGYSYHKFSILAKLSNITNELNYVVHDRYSINPIPPRQFLTTVAYKF